MASFPMIIITSFWNYTFAKEPNAAKKGSRSLKWASPQLFQDLYNQMKPSNFKYRKSKGVLSRKTYHVVIRYEPLSSILILSNKNLDVDIFPYFSVFSHFEDPPHFSILIFNEQDMLPILDMCYLLGLKTYARDARFSNLSSGKISNLQQDYNQCLMTMITLVSLYHH